MSDLLLPRLFKYFGVVPDNIDLIEDQEVEANCVIVPCRNLNSFTSLDHYGEYKGSRCMRSIYHHGGGGCG